MLLFRRFVNLFRRNELAEDIEAELRAHLELRTADNIKAGMSPDNARRDAALRFGNVLALRERTAAVDVSQSLDHLARDLAFGVRQLRRSPAFAATAILTLAVAIAANLVAFSVLNSLLLQPLTPRGSERLFNIAQGPHAYDNQSYPDYLDYQSGSSTFSAMAAYRMSFVGLRDGNVARRCWDLEVSGNYFDMLGIHPALGRFFHPSDEHGPDSAPFVVLSDSIWRAQFASDPKVIGSLVHLNAHPFTVIGVAPPSFHGTERFLWPDIWVPIVNERQLEGYDFLSKRFNHGIWIIGLLKDGVSVGQAADNLNSIATRLARLYPSSNEGMKARLVKPGLLGDQIGDPARDFLSALMTLVFLVFVAASTNIAGLCVARFSERHREFGIRLSIGAGRWRIIRQLITEALLISCSGGLVGSVGALSITRLLTHWRPFALPVGVAITSDFRVYAIAGVLSIIGAVLPTVLPALQIWRTDLTGVMKASANLARPGRVHFRDLLLAGQIAICALLLTSALVALRGLHRSSRAPLGFDPEGALLAETDTHMAGYTGELTIEFQKRLIAQATRLPGVTAAGVVDDAPLGTGGSSTPVYPAGNARFRPVDSSFTARYFSISPGYLNAAATRLLAGRDVSWHDTNATPNVALVNECFARRLFGFSNPLGRKFKTGPNDSYEVVGIVETGKYESLGEAATPTIFFPSSQAPNTDLTLVVRSSLPTPQIAAALNALLSNINPKLPYTIQTWPEELNLVFFPARIATSALAAMGLLASALALTGVFGVAAYSVSKRTREFGIRMALGSRSSQLIRTALGRSALVLLAGSVTGLCLGLISSNLLGQIVYGASPRDPVVLGAVMAAMLGLGVAATWIPARRALAVNPARLLREEG